MHLCKWQLNNSLHEEIPNTNPLFQRLSGSRLTTTELHRRYCIHTNSLLGIPKDTKQIVVRFEYGRYDEFLSYNSQQLKHTFGRYIPLTNLPNVAIIPLEAPHILQSLSINVLIQQKWATFLKLPPALHLISFSEIYRWTISQDIISSFFAQTFAVDIALSQQFWWF